MRFLLTVINITHFVRQYNYFFAFFPELRKNNFKMYQLLALSLDRGGNSSSKMAVIIVPINDARAIKLIHSNKIIAELKAW